MEVLSNVSPCSILLEAQLKAIKEKSKDPEAAEPEPEPTTEVLFLCSYQGCGKTFIDAGALRKHSHIHGEKQYVCNYDNCVKGLCFCTYISRLNVKRGCLSLSHIGVLRSHMVLSGSFNKVHCYNSMQEIFG
ncbi:unnamed protein product [Ilex paraguariensis]|uniref:C2H2-type domain-containing protein n=1 Tax=Ilex paraguariensis TaxID=185542 RepID=A0ABC8TJK6_9AQUA